MGFGFGASFVALFAQLGGGIYTKAADVGADLVGKVEAGIPEDDPRNPAVIADLVGDNVGDCAGRGADLFESTAAENIGAMILGVLFYEVTGANQPGVDLVPARDVRFGLIASMVGILSAHVSGHSESEVTDKVGLAALNSGYYVTSIISAIAIMGLSFLMLPGTAKGGATPGLWYGLAGLVGIATSIGFVFITQYYTAGAWRPVREIAEASKTGPATTIISGIAVGFETTALPAISIAIALGASYVLGQQGNPVGQDMVSITVPGVAKAFDLAMASSTAFRALLAVDGGAGGEVLHATTIGSNTDAGRQGRAHRADHHAGASATSWKFAICACRCCPTCTGPSRARWWSGDCGWR